MPQAGIFFSFDGIDGAGKTTQRELFCQWLSARGHSVVTCRDPGGTELGEAIREILLHRVELTMGPRSEMLLYMASRAQLVEEVISPALAAGKTVVSDRFLLANVVYQGSAGGLDVEDIWQVGSLATSNIRPHLTFLLDMPVRQAAGRLNRAPDRMESRGEDYLERVRQGFLEQAERLGSEIAVIEAGRDADAVQTDIRRAAESVCAELKTVPGQRGELPAKSPPAGRNPNPATRC